MEDVRVSSNWDFINQSSLNKIVTHCSSENTEYDIEKVTTDSCVCLSRPQNDTFESKPTLEIKSRCLLKQVDILSEGTLIEVFGNCDEYLCSCSSVLIDDWDGMAVFHTKISLPGITNCTLKFKRMKNNTRLWIYGVQLLTLPEVPSSSEIQFNLENVNKLIKDTNISEKAEKFKSFFEIYMKNSTHLKNLSSQSPELKILMNFIKNENKLQLESSKNGECFKEPSISNYSTREKDDGEEKLSHDDSVTSINSEVIEYFKSYIDDRLNKMKEEFLEQIDVKLNKYQEETNNKLEKIIQLLSSMKK